jgi:hypothetical protein
LSRNQVLTDVYAPVGSCVMLKILARAELHMEKSLKSDRRTRCFNSRTLVIWFDLTCGVIMVISSDIHVQLSKGHLARK